DERRARAADVQRRRGAGRRRLPPLARLEQGGTMSQRTERIAGEVRAVVGEVLARQEIKDPRVRGAGLITVTHVRMSGDLRQARALFTVHGAGEAELERVRE